MDKNHNDVNKFWDNFCDLVIKSGISEKYADSYVKWGEKFAISIKGKPLHKRTVDDIKTFLEKIKNQKNIREWEVKQAREALYLLYYKFLKIELEIPKPDKTTEVKKVAKQYENIETDKKVAGRLGDVGKKVNIIDIFIYLPTSPIST